MATLSTNHGVEILIDDEDYEELSKYKWYKMKIGYIYRVTTSSINRHSIFIHREVLSAPKGLQVDHINRDPLDNRRVNLRICTAAENSANVARRGGVSVYKGVYRRRDGRWIAGVISEHINHWLGSYATEEEAGMAYNNGALYYHNDFAVLNDIPGYTPGPIFIPKLYKTRSTAFNNNV